MVQVQPEQTVCETPSPKQPQQNGLGVCGSSGRVPALQAQSPEFKPQFHKKELNIEAQ
jgi:hypothetical protein